MAVSGSPASGRLDQAVAAFVREEFAAPVSGIIGFVDILLEDARRDGLDDCTPDLERIMRGDHRSKQRANIRAR